jgi:RimJ/RimL family protein N-acetyltransferase
MAAGEVCIVGHAPGSAAEPVYMCWLSRRDNSLQTLLGAPPPEGEACVKNVWVHPDRRRRGIAVCGERYAIGAAQRHGVRRLWAFIMPSNTASIVLHERLGFGRAGELVFGETLARRWAAFEEGGLRRSLTLCPADARVL